MSKVILQGYIIVPDSDLEAVKLALGTHSRLTKQEPGCLVFEVKPDPKNPNRFNVYEEFTSQGAFDCHQLRVISSTWGQVTKQVTRHYKVINC